MQMLGAAINAFSQGIAYYHAGIDTLRSKSMDRNSYNSGDWFNRLDWSYADNNFGVGAPPQADNGDNWALIKPLLANAAIAGRRRDRLDARYLRDLLAIRASSTLFRLRTAEDVKRAAFPQYRLGQVPTVLAGHLDGNGYRGANFRELLYFVNVDKQPQALVLDADKGKAWRLHPVYRGRCRPPPGQRRELRAGQRPLVIPPRSAVVYVLD